MAKTPAKTIEFLHAVPVPEVVVRRLRLYPAFMFEPDFGQRVFRLIRQAHCLGKCIDYELTLGHLMDLTVFALDQCKWLDPKDRSWVARVMLYLNLEFRVHPEMSPSGDPRLMLREPIEPHDRRCDGWRPTYDDNLRSQESLWIRQMREMDHDTGETVVTPTSRTVTRKADCDTITYKGVVVARRERLHQPENGDAPIVIEEFYHPRLEEWVSSCWLFAFAAEYAYTHMTPDQAFPQEVRDAQAREAQRAKIAARVLPPDIARSVDALPPQSRSGISAMRTPSVRPPLKSDSPPKSPNGLDVDSLMKRWRQSQDGSNGTSADATASSNGSAPPAPASPASSRRAQIEEVISRRKASPPPPSSPLSRPTPPAARPQLVQAPPPSASSVTPTPPPPTTSVAPVLRSKNVLPPETRSHPTRVDDMATRYAERQARATVPRELSAEQRADIAALSISSWRYIAGSLRAIPILLQHNIGTVGDLARCSITDLRDWGITPSILAQIELGLSVDGFWKQS